jgi:hypothetical protein
MRKSIAVFTLVLAMATQASAGSRTLTQAADAGSIQTLSLESGIGDVQMTGDEASNAISVEVVLTPRRGGLFSSMRAAEHEVEAASLKLDTRDGTLHVTIDPPADEERRFEERWTIELPSRLAINLDHGVGDVSIVGTESGIEIDAGVGDVLIDAERGDIVVDLGVGTAVVRAPAGSVSHASGAGGVGDVKLSVLGEQIEGGGFISDASSWDGDGESRIEVSVGVGDVVIELD